MQTHTRVASRLDGGRSDRFHGAAWLDFAQLLIDGAGEGAQICFFAMQLAASGAREVHQVINQFTHLHRGLKDVLQEFLALLVQL